MITVDNKCVITLSDYFSDATTVVQDNIDPDYVVTAINVTVLNYQTNVTSTGNLITIPFPYVPVVDTYYGTIDNNGIYTLNDQLFNSTSNSTIKAGIYKITIKKNYTRYSDGDVQLDVLIEETNNIVLICSTICCAIKASSVEDANVCEIWSLVEALKQASNCEISGYDLATILTFLQNQINLINCGC